MSCDRCLIDITQKFFNSLVHTTHLFQCVLENPPLQEPFPKTAVFSESDQPFHRFSVRTEGETASKKIRFQMKTHQCGLVVFHLH